MSPQPQTVSVVTPTFRRPDEVRGLLANLAEQDLMPLELVLVDGAGEDERATEAVVMELKDTLPFNCVYIRHSGGTAIQRNVGIDAAQGQYIAFVDDDVRLEPPFLRTLVDVFEQPQHAGVGGIVGYRTTSHFSLQSVNRWRWYKRLGLLTTYEPGRYDYETGYPINANLQPPFSGVRPVDFMTTACALWRREVMDAGLRFDHFFRNYGILEDAHFSLRAGKTWKLLQCGDALCEELSSPHGREGSEILGYKKVINYYYVFRSIVQPLTWQHQVRFWRYQFFELGRMLYSGITRRRRGDLLQVKGRLRAFQDVARGVAFDSASS